MVKMVVVQKFNNESYVKLEDFNKMFNDDIRIAVMLSNHRMEKNYYSIKESDYELIKVLMDSITKRGLN